MNYYQKEIKKLEAESKNLAAQIKEIRGQMRHPADIKRIRELETALDRALYLIESNIHSSVVEAAYLLKNVLGKK
jgi:hypothetical protein